MLTRKTDDLLAAIIAAVLGLVTVFSADALAADAKLRKHTLNAGDRERTYLLYLPPIVLRSDEKRPLVLVFHGGGGTSRGIAREVGRSLHAEADEHGFVVAYPNAVKKTWDFGAGKVSEALRVRVDDRLFFERLMDELVETLPIDEERIFAMGISRGGQASYFVACQFPERIRAIAPVAMPMPEFMTKTCRARDIGLAVFNGTDDPIVPYDGGEITVGRKQRGLVMSTDKTVDFWRQKNGCDPSPDESDTIDPASDRMRVLRIAWQQCREAPVVLYRIEGGGHTWPSGRQYLPRRRVGNVNKDIDGAKEIWAFFSQFGSRNGS